MLIKASRFLTGCSGDERALSTELVSLDGNVAHQGVPKDVNKWLLIRCIETYTWAVNVENRYTQDHLPRVPLQTSLLCGLNTYHLS